MRLPVIKVVSLNELDSRRQTGTGVRVYSDSVYINNLNMYVTKTGFLEFRVSPT